MVPSWEPNFGFIDLSVVTLLGDKFITSYQLLVIGDKVIIIDLSVIMITFFIIASSYADGKVKLLGRAFILKWISSG